MTETDICNLALDRIGEPMISDFAENSPNAITCRRHYEAVRDSLLRSHPWNFATGRAQLTADSTAPEFGYSYSYQLPVDCLRELTLNGVEAKKCEASYTIEGRKLLTDASEARITYVKKVEDPNDFDSLFSDVLAFRLAAAIAVSVTGSESKRDGMEQMAALRLNDASFVDANETSPRVLSPLRAGRRSRSNDFRDYGNAPDAGVDLDNGEDGANGWTPTFAVVSDGDRRVLWVTSWTGGAGDEPDAGYLGASGIVASAATAVDIRGIQGEIGPFGTNLHIGLTAPEDPEGFPLWWKSDVGLLMIWYDDGTSEQWVSAVGAGPVGPSAYQSYVDTTSDDPVLSEAAWIESLGGGGGGTWGSITGTLSDQTDLQAALDGKADALGADDNYVTDAEKTKLSNLSGTNSGDLTLDATVADIFGLTGQALSADDAGADSGVFWDDSEGKLDFFTFGTGLTMTGTVLSVNFSAPPAIGDDTPNAGYFTTLESADSVSISDMTDTWNDSGTTFTALKMNVTNTASNAASLLFDFQIGGTSRLKLGLDGLTIGTGTGDMSRLLLTGASGAGFFAQYNTFWMCQGPGNIGFAVLGNGETPNGASCAIAGENSAAFKFRSGNAVFQLGFLHATTPTTQTLKAHDVTTGTGANLIAKGGTGSVADGLFGFGTHSAIGAESVTGYITIVDEGGTTRKLAVVS